MEKNLGKFKNTLNEIWSKMLSEIRVLPPLESNCHLKYEKIVNVTYKFAKPASTEFKGENKRRWGEYEKSISKQNQV